MAQHTPGPWQQHDDVYPYGPSFAATVWGPKGPGFGLVADCRQSNGRAADLANARLIAAAPDMLAALKACAERLAYLGEDHEAWTVDAHAAIAKADGRAP